MGYLYSKLGRMLFNYLPDETSFTAFNSRYILHVLYAVFLVVFALVFVGIDFLVGVAFSTELLKLILIEVLFIALTLFVMQRAARFIGVMARVARKLHNSANL